jgi:hypothetical protein
VPKSSNHTLSFHRLASNLLQLLTSHGYLLLVADSVLSPESYIMTDSQSATLSWNKELIWGLWPDIYYFAGLLMWGALSDKRTGLLFTIAAALASALTLGSESHRTRDHILLSQIQDFIFVASYDLQGYAGCIWPRLHAGLTDTILNSKSHCDWRSVSKSWYRAPSGAHDQILLFDSYGLVFVGRPKTKNM